MTSIGKGGPFLLGMQHRSMNGTSMDIKHFIWLQMMQKVELQLAFICTILMQWVQNFLNTFYQTTVVAWCQAASISSKQLFTCSFIVGHQKEICTEKFTSQEIGFVTFFTDVTFSPDPKLTYRITGGVMVFYVFIGDSQEEVVRQYHALIGKPLLTAFKPLFYNFYFCRTTNFATILGPWIPAQSLGLSIS